MGGSCRIRNPWGVNERIDIYKSGKLWKTISGSLFSIPTELDDLLVMVKSGTSPDQFRHVIATNYEVGES